MERKDFPNSHFRIVLPGMKSWAGILGSFKCSEKMWRNHNLCVTFDISIDYHNNMQNHVFS